MPIESLSNSPGICPRTSTCNIMSMSMSNHMKTGLSILGKTEGSELVNLNDENMEGIHKMLDSEPMISQQKVVLKEIKVYKIDENHFSTDFGDSCDTNSTIDDTIYSQANETTIIKNITEASNAFIDCDTTEEIKVYFGDGLNTKRTLGDTVLSQANVTTIIKNVEEANNAVIDCDPDTTEVDKMLGSNQTICDKNLYNFQEQTGLNTISFGLPQF